MSGVALGVWREQKHPAWDGVVKQVQKRGAKIGNATLDAAGVHVDLHAVGMQHPCIESRHNLHLVWAGRIFEAAEDVKWVSANTLAHGLMNSLESAENVPAALLQALDSVDGPYAFVLVDTLRERVYYGRDPLGRRSLLHMCDGSAFYLASVGCTEWAHTASFEEVPCDALWQIDLRAAEQKLMFQSFSRSLFFVPSISTPHDEHVSRFGSILSASVKARVNGLNRLALLFSGGLDCTVLAALAAQQYEGTIDLINVAFENPRAIRAAVKAIQERGEEMPPSDTFPSDPYAVPDRVTAQHSYAQLCTLFSPEKFRLVCVNVAHAEYVSRLDTMKELMYPQSSVMDLSISAALYFASEGHGVVGDQTYASNAHIVLSGLGADELLGGYARHRQAWRRGGYEALTRELQLDLERLPTRNLGRDDRVLSAHAREARYPYLARSVITFLARLPVQIKTHFETDLGDKYLLRLLATQIGLTYAAKLPKRAIQFGTRSAKMDAANAHAKGTVKLSELAAQSV